MVEKLQFGQMEPSRIPSYDILIAWAGVCDKL